MKEATVFICGVKPDHECDSEGPTLYGGDELVSAIGANDILKHIDVETVKTHFQLVERE